jgi:hypothetical protein
MNRLENVINKHATHNSITDIKEAQTVNIVTTLSCFIFRNDNKIFIILNYYSEEEANGRRNEILLNASHPGASFTKTILQVRFVLRPKFVVRLS